MFENPFVLPKEEYRRDLNIMKHYAEQAATYLSKTKKVPYEQALNFVKKTLSASGKRPFKDPRIEFTDRADNGDRTKVEGTLYGYLTEAVKSADLIAPTLTTYRNPKYKQSLLVNFIDANVKKRGVAKKAMFKAKMDGDKTLENIKMNEQTNAKLSNNSISGAHVSPSTPLYNKTGHSTLTSNCRSTSGFGNANNEKFLCGNRHYHCVDVVLNNITSIVQMTNYPQFGAAMAKFGIRPPTIQETMDCITYSTNLYWHNSQATARIASYISALTDIERAAFVYTGDMYHLMKYNEEVVRVFLDKLSLRVVPAESEKLDSEAITSKVMEETMHLAYQICPNEMRGKKFKDIAGTVDEQIVLATALNIESVLAEYHDMIRALWVTKIVPASLGWFPSSIRRSALTSDTDSTIFTVQDWVKWHQGRIHFKPEGQALAASVIFLAAQGITHILARMSANFGIEKDRLFQIAMKNEFKFDIFVPTQVAKHYYALIGCQEGNLFDPHDTEIKGVHLRSSSAPPQVMKAAKKMMVDIMDSVMNEKLIEIKKIYKTIADIERDIEATIKSGSPKYFRRAQVKTADSYKLSPEKSNYFHYPLWEEVFAPKYGSTQEPPYMCVRVSGDTDSATRYRDWINNMEDKELAARMQAWMKKYNKAYIGSFLLPQVILQSQGIPKEILDIVDIRKLIKDATSVFYLILETLGVYLTNEVLVMDYY